MLTIYSGKPGASKTLNVLFEVEKLRQETGRPVFFTNVKNCTMPGWKEWPVEKVHEWRELPAGSIWVLDEAQDFYPQRGTQKEAPKHVTDFSTHRHLGIDVYFITQNPMLIDIWLRRLCNRHVHVVRPWQKERAELYEWASVQDADDARGFAEAKKNAVVTRRPFPREIYPYYKSAEVHTHKPRRPVGIYLKLGGLSAAVVALVAFAYWRLAAQSDEVQAAAVQASGAAQQAAAASLAVSSAVERLTLALERFKPSIPGAPWSAPFYDPLVEPSVLPYVSGCASVKVGTELRCQCYDQQGTEIPMSLEVCMVTLRKGVFDWSGQRTAELEANAAAISARKGSGLQLEAFGADGAAEAPALGAAPAAAHPPAS